MPPAATSAILDMIWSHGKIVKEQICVFQKLIATVLTCTGLQYRMDGGLSYQRTMT